MGGVTLCVPTCRRPALLARLLTDVGRQTRRPDRWIIVCGEGGSPAVRQALAEARRRPGTPPVRLIPSTRANLPFQRRLGWQAAADAERLVYLDDDLELPAPDAFERLLEPLDADPDLVAVTAPIETGGAPAAPRRQPVRWGAAAGAAPGGLTPTGVRLPPLDDGEPWARVAWLRGGVMAFRRAALAEDCFPADLFALAAVGCGLGEDLILARRAAARGALALARGARFVHPGSDAPQAYASDIRRRAFAHAYSRRLVNDHYRAPDRPRLADRLALLRTYAGGTARRLAAGELAELAGYFAGAWRGLVTPPRAARLTPDVDWEAEIRRSLAAAETVEEEVCV